ncbi:MAG: nucleoside hydrolase, partial [Thermofilaceae archaeon]
MVLKVALDTDIGDDIDDAFAIALACLSPELDLVAVTTVYGDVKKRAILAARLLRSLGKENIPVACGASQPLLNPKPDKPPLYYFPSETDNRYTNIVSKHAVDLLEELVEDEKIDAIISVGPLTNVALFYLKRPDLVNRVRLFSMCGAFFINTSEYNIKCDPEAASIVLNAGFKKTLVGLDVTLKCSINQEMLNALRFSQKDYGKTLWSYTETWMKQSGHLPILHDPLAVAVTFK